MLKRISVSRQYAPLRVCADICFYFYALSLFSFSVLYTVSGETGVHAIVTNLVEPWSRQLALLVASCFAVGLLAVRFDSAAPRFVLSFLPGLSFLLMRPFQPAMLLHAAAWLYFVAVMTIGNFEIHLDVYRRRARVMLFTALLLTLCLIIFHFGTDDWYYSKLFGGEIYGLLFFVLAVLSLRGMRSDHGAPEMMRILDTAYVVALPALLVAVFFLLRGTVPAITFLFSMLSRFLIWLFRTVFPHRDLPELYHQLDELDVNKRVPGDPLLMPVAGDQSPGEEMMGGQNLHFHFSSHAALYVMIAILAAALIFVVIRMMIGRQKSADKPRLVRERVSRASFEGLLRRRSDETSLPANVRQIRKIYRSYLDHIRSLRVKIVPSDTSEDVLAYSSKCLDIPENAALRELYIAARYGDPKAVTSAQVGMAKRCLAAIEAARTGSAK